MASLALCCRRINGLDSHNKSYYCLHFTDEQTEAQRGPETAGMKVLKWSEWRKVVGGLSHPPAYGEVAENLTEPQQPAPESCRER